MNSCRLYSCKFYSMAKPREVDISKIYYHGTSKESNGLSILREGIKAPDIGTRKSRTIPVKGKVYLTPSLKYAIIYTLGANMLGEDISSFVKKDGRYGYLFVIRGADLIDINPDEDSIGEILYILLEEDAGRDVDYASNDYVGIDNFGWLLDMGRRYLSERQLQGVADGDYSYWAQAGKKLVKEMKDIQKLKLIDAGAHIAHGGSIIPIEAWKYDKLRNTELKSDGSNFFDIAKRVR